MRSNGIAEFAFLISIFPTPNFQGNLLRRDYPASFMYYDDAVKQIDGWLCVGECFQG